MYESGLASGYFNIDYTLTDLTFTSNVYNLIHSVVV